MSIWKWNDVELEVDMEDADFQEKYENAFQRLYGGKRKRVAKSGEAF